MKVNRQFLEPRADAAELFEPADALLDHAPAAIGAAIKPNRRIVPGDLAVLVRDDRFNLLLGEPVAQPLHAVTFVTGQLRGLVPTPPGLASPSDQAGHRLT